MIIKSKELIPAIYSESYDVSIFTGLLDLLYTGRTLDDLRAKVCHCSKHCFKEDLVHLASFFGFGEEATRDVLTDYRSLVKVKGTEQAVKAVISHSYGGVIWSEVKPEVYQDENNETHVRYQDSDFVFSKGVVTAYVDIKEERATLFLELLKRLAPVDVVVTVLPEAENPNKKTENPSDKSE